MAFGQFDGVTIGILDPGYVILAPGPVGPWLAGDRHPLRLQPLAELINVRWQDRHVPRPGGHPPVPVRAAGLDQLQSRSLILAAVAQISYPLIPLRRVAQTHDVHAEKPGVKVNGTIEIAYRQHGVPDTELAVAHGSLSAPATC
ncbi:MAG: hypothetical protein O7B35_02685 [Deltaproteobacteria bacterium]|nr:hypothetical protein [Deltaproteobacteria bacterium]